MAGKRLRDEIDRDCDQPEGKRMDKLPSFTTVIKEAVMANYATSFKIALEPLIRRVVREEVEQGLLHCARMLQRSPQLQIEEAESPSLQLIFKNPVSQPIFTNTKVEDVESSPLQLLLVDGEGSLMTMPSPLRVEIVVIDGDFGDHDNWTSARFNKSIVKERAGKRPLLTGDVNVTLRDGIATISDLSFTDNSSWIRSRNFQIGARVVPGSQGGLRIKEALTRPFMVKDHRGELYKKHYPPALGDDVWRLEKIGKDGAFHRKLSAANINTVHDFLKLWAVDPDQLRMILGVGMSEKMWEGTISHARTCIVGEKLYLYRAQFCNLVLSPICEVLEVMMDGTMLAPENLNRAQRVYVQQQVREAFKNWDSLEEANGLIAGNNALLQNELVVPQSMYQLQNTVVGYDELELSQNNTVWF